MNKKRYWCNRTGLPSSFIRSRPPSSEGSPSVESSTDAGVSANSARLGYGISTGCSSCSNAALKVWKKNLASGPENSES